MADEIRKRVYIIPRNFAIEGKVFGFDKRNMLEAAVVLVALVVPVLVFVPTVNYKIYGCIICLAPALATLMGVNGLSITSYLADVIHYKACSMVYATPTKEAILIRERQIIKEKHRIAEERKNQAKKEEKALAVQKKREKKEKKRSAKKARKSKGGVFG